MTAVINALFDIVGWAWRTLRKLVGGLVKVALPGQASGVRLLVTWAIILLIVIRLWVAVRHGLTRP